MKALSIAGFGAVALLALFAVALGVNSPTAEAAPVSFAVQATGANEVGGVDSPGSALGRFTFDRDTRVLTYAVTVSGLSANLVTASHIHRGAAGVNGPIIYPLSLVGFTQVSGSITLTDGDVKDLDSGNFYLNVHSTANPGGFARGQLILPEAAPSAPAMAAVTPPNTGDAGLAASESTSMVPALFLALMGFLGTGAVVAVARRAH